MFQRLGTLLSKGKGPPSLRRLASLPTLVSAGVAGGVLVLLATRFDVDWAAAWSHVISGNVALYVGALLVNVFGLLVRALRWRLVAGNAGVGRTAGGRLPGHAETATLVLAGWFLNSVGWFRMGDAYRAFAFGRSAGVPFSLSLGIIAAERVMDVLAVVPLLLLGVTGAVLLEESGGPLTYVVIALALAALGIVFLAVLAFVGKRLARGLPPALRSAYLSFHQGALKSFRRLPAVAVLSLGAWLMESLRLYLVVQALDLPLSAPLVLFVSLVNAVLTTIPFTPGGLGFVEPGIIGALSLALARDSAVAVAVVDRSISYGSIVVLGGLALAAYELVWLRRRARASHPALPQSASQASEGS